MGRNNAREYPVNFLEKGIREKNEVKYPKNYRCGYEKEK